MNRWKGQKQSEAASGRLGWTERVWKVDTMRNTSFFGDAGGKSHYCYQSR